MAKTFNFTVYRLEFLVTVKLQLSGITLPVVATEIKKPRKG